MHITRLHLYGSEAGGYDWCVCVSFVSLHLRRRLAPYRVNHPAAIIWLMYRFCSANVYIHFILRNLRLLRRAISRAEIKFTNEFECCVLDVYEPVFHIYIYCI